MGMVNKLYCYRFYPRIFNVKYVPSIVIIIIITFHGDIGELLYLYIYIIFRLSLILSPDAKYLDNKINNLLSLSQKIFKFIFFQIRIFVFVLFVIDLYFKFKVLLSQN